ncbi:hypothetical protein X777_05703 [Ooceraea biroi]|uniref:Uncharacterized protein n=1 Tax=Ooceraea biroi TaxID=2015173 RepID=A0A026WES6_OOCBI|nr:hypothetical protein X777_05703 [Ooceraea biroi]
MQAMEIAAEANAYHYVMREDECRIKKAEYAEEEITKEARMCRRQARMEMAEVVEDSLYGAGIDNSM